jgi:RNA polymerase sigma-70 factor (ECF subfamily)
MKTWLFGIALRVAKDYRRRAAKGAADVAIDDDTLVGTDPDPRQAALETESARLVQRALDALEEGRRAVFIMTELEGFTAAEIGESLGVPINTVYSRLRLARRDFIKSVRLFRARADWRQT